MRRKDREVTEEKRIDDIIESCQCCRVGLYDNGEIYIVPLDFGYENSLGKRTLYFHGAKSGRKAELIEKKPFAGFEMDVNHRLVKAEGACDHSSEFQSIIGSGRISVIEEESEKEKAMNIIMKKKTGMDNWEYDRRVLERTNLYKLEVEKISCKEHIL